MSNDFLVDYLSENFEDSLITYSSSEKKPDSQITIIRDNVSVFPYFLDNIPEHGFGTSATVLVRVDGNVVVRSLSGRQCCRKESGRQCCRKVSV